MSASENLYAKLLTAEPEPTTEEDKRKLEESTKVKRKVSIRVGFISNMLKSVLIIKTIFSE